MSAQPWHVAPLRLPLDDDTTLEVPPIGYDDGLTLRQLLEDGETDSGLTLRSDDQELAKLCLGAHCWELLQSSSPSFPVVFRAGLAAVQYQVALVLGQPCEAAVQAGEQVWEAGVDPEAVAAVIAAALQSSRQQATGSTSSTSTDEDIETPSPAATSGTKSRTGTRRKSPTKRGTSSRSRGSSSRASGASSSSPTSPPSTASGSTSDPT